jgi:microcystin-dependent protein
VADPFVGEIRAFPFNFAPKGWAKCQGQLMALSQNTALFSLLGTFYGGDGKSTFALPDLRGRVPIAFGQGPGLSEYDIGQHGGDETVTLLPSEITAHTHAIDLTNMTLTRRCLEGPGTRGSPVNALPANEAPAQTVSYSPGDPTGTMHPTAVQFTGGLPAALAGGGMPHNNMQPYLALNFCIALQGVFPPRG